jgi:hypothetical protein
MDPIEAAAVRDDMERLYMVSREAVVQAANALVKIADEAMRLRAELARQALADSQAAAATTADRIRAERDLAAATWDTRLQDRTWFDHAPAEEILQTWASAEGWRQTGDPRAAAACERLRLEVRRLGVDPDLAQSAVSARDAQALTDLLGDPTVDGSQTTGAKEPEFPVSIVENETVRQETISKDDALRSIEEATGPIPPYQEEREYFDQYQSWVGRDPDVDAALSAKWPERFPAPPQSAADTVAEEGTKTRPAGPGRPPAGRGRDEEASDDLQRMTDLVANSMQPTEATAILADPNWPRVAGQLSRAQTKINTFNAANPKAPIDLPKVLSDLQFNRPSNELRTPAGWLIWQLHNRVAANGVQLAAQAHPDGHQVRTRRDSGTRSTRGHGRSTRSAAPRRDTERGGS